MEMADLYEKMGSQKNINFEELVATLEAVLQKHSSRFHHPILGRLEGGFQTEVDVVTQLLCCQAQVSEWHFLPALLSLHGASSKLTAWGQLFQRQRETRKHLFGGQSQKAVQPPYLYAWLQRFHEALSRQTASADMKALTARTAPDYHGKICLFIRKHDANNVSLVFDNRGLDSFQGHGYHHPHSYREAPKGVEQFPAVVSLPGGERPLTHWPNLNTLDKVVHFYDDKVQSTYYLTRRELHFTLVVIFDGRKSEKDSHITAFLQEISGSLRNSKPLSTLKPGSKG
uniref:KICSTOR subunit 2 n=1 Tax=Hucho hucho TaxID=62062 RepID=A0A4W5L7P2_9TELE